MLYKRTHILTQSVHFLE